MHNHLLKVIMAVSAASLAAAQTSLDVPNLSTATLTTASTTSATTSSAATTSFPALSTSTPTSTKSATVVTSGGSTFALGSNFPTIAGAGIPTMIVPNTAGAPFMQQSDLPQGTVFIAIGSVLAFMGACVLLWRGLVAWSVNRSVKRAALASIHSGSEKTSKNWGGAGTGYNPARKIGMYHDLGSNVSMEALTPTGKQIKPNFKDYDSGRSTPPPANLFFSPTAHGRNNVPSVYSDTTRTSSYLPAGYYAQPSSHAAGGARNTVMGGVPPPYARNSSYEPSPPGSPALRPARGTLHPRASNDNLRAPSREGMRNTVYSQASNSSLAANIGGARPSSSGLAGSRAPSAYLEDLFENHTAMASRDRL